MEKTAIGILREEHDRVLEILKQLETHIRNKDILACEERINFLDKEFDEHSLNKEEKILFPEIEKFMPREEGPTGMMILEHKDLVESMKQFKEHAKKQNIQNMTTVGTHIISLLRQHIDKENNILFMIADMHLEKAQKESILAQFKKREAKHKCCENC